MMMDAKDKRERVYRKSRENGSDAMVEARDKRDGKRENVYKK